ncbi:MAG: reverse transcriptase domain-containing protein, partial [Gemmatimonadales bacterium]|nr:reverse transcriptase domain-containing protein [Gemmatimonadales bacterium]
MEELRAAIAEHPVGAATDPDGIAPRLLRHLPPAALAWLLAVLNRCLAEASLPRQWRTGVATPLLKSGKDATQVASYRPVVQTSLLSRTLERVVARRVRAVVDPRLDQHQFGFRPGHAADLAVGMVVRAALDGWSFADRFLDRRAAEEKHAAGRGEAPPKRHDGRNVRVRDTLLAAVDFADAFCSFPPAACAVGLARLGAPAAEAAWIASFLAGRTLRVRVGSRLSAPRPTPWGVPQGSVLGPLLWLVVADSLACRLSRLLPRLPATCGFALFADDLSVWATQAHGSDLAPASVAMQHLLREVADWAAMTGVAVSPKTAALRFSRSPRAADEPTVPLTCGPVALAAGPGCIRILGVEIDSRLNFSAHTEKVVGKLEAVAVRLRRFVALLRPSQLRVVAAACGLSAATYASHVWWPVAAADSRDRIVPRLTDLASLASGCTRTASADAIWAEVRWLPFPVLVRRQSLRRAEQVARLPASCPARAALLAPQPAHDAVPRCAWSADCAAAAATPAELAPWRGSVPPLSVSSA